PCGSGKFRPMRDSPVAPFPIPSSPPLWQQVPLELSSCWLRFTVTLPTVPLLNGNGVPIGAELVSGAERSSVRVRVVLDSIFRPALPLGKKNALTPAVPST